MSGTEAVMCAIRLCRFNTRRKLIVQFADLIRMPLGVDFLRFLNLKVASMASARRDATVTPSTRLVNERRRFSDGVVRAGWWDGASSRAPARNARTVTFYISRTCTPPL